MIRRFRIDTPQESIYMLIRILDDLRAPYSFRVKGIRFEDGYAIISFNEQHKVFQDIAQKIFQKGTQVIFYNQQPICSGTIEDVKWGEGICEVQLKPIEKLEVK